MNTYSLKTAIRNLKYYILRFLDTDSTSFPVSQLSIYIYKLSLSLCEVRLIPWGNHFIYQVQILYPEQTKRLTLLTEGSSVIKIISTKNKRLLRFKRRGPLTSLQCNQLLSSISTE